MKEPSEEPSESPQSPQVTKEGQNRGTSHDPGRGKAQTRPDILPTGHHSPESSSDGTAVQQDLLQCCSASTEQPVSLAKLITRCVVLIVLQGQVVPNCHAMMRAEVRRSEGNPNQPVYIYAMVLDRLGREANPRETNPLET
jgi:hypothetical protein